VAAYGHPATVEQRRDATTRADRTKADHFVSDANAPLREKHQVYWHALSPVSRNSRACTAGRAQDPVTKRRSWLTSKAR
jgi:hypothetical protein